MSLHKLGSAYLHYNIFATFCQKGPECTTGWLKGTTFRYNQPGFDSRSKIESKKAEQLSSNRRRNNDKSKNNRIYLTAFYLMQLNVCCHTIMKIPRAQVHEGSGRDYFYLTSWVVDCKLMKNDPTFCKGIHIDRRLWICCKTCLAFKNTFCCFRNCF